MKNSSPESIRKIIIIAHFCGNFEDGDNNRFCYIASMLAGRGNDVEIVTSSFSHRDKTQKEKNALRWPFKITLLKEPGYTRSVCLRRLYSHFIWSINLRKYLSEHNDADVVYSSVPSLSGALAAADYCKYTKTRFVIDIQDLWPEAFKMVFNVPIISDLILKPLTVMADRIYKQADEIFAVSETYLKRALSVNKKCSSGTSIFIGTDFERFKNNALETAIMNKPAGEFWLGYCGTLGYSYDLKCVMDAMALLKHRVAVMPRLIVMGDGPRKKEFEDYASDKGLHVCFTGWLSYNKMCGLLSACDIAINPISPGSAGSIINKHADYAASGLPVINTQECTEYRDLVDKYNMGINCRCGNSEDVAQALIVLMEDKELRSDMGQNALRCATECFDRRMSYEPLIRVLEE